MTYDSGIQLIVTNDVPWDRFYIAGTSPFASFNLSDFTSTVFSSTALPSTLELTDFDQAGVTWNDSPNGFSGTIYSITYIPDQPPGFSKSFSPDAIDPGGVSTLTFTIDNTANSVSVTSLDFTDNLPAGLVVASPNNASVTCTGGTLTATSGTGVISYTGGTLSAGASCTIQVDVTSAAAGTYNNTTGDLTSSLGNSGTASATLTVNSLQEAIEDLIALVISMDLNKGLTKALTTKLYEAIDYLNSGDNAGAVDALNAFINHVEAQRGKKLTNEQADQLIAETQHIIDAINASSLPKQSSETITQNSIPLAYHLDQNYPNPFNPTTQIRFGIPQAGNVTLKIYNSVGQLVKTLVDGNMSEGYYQVNWDARDNNGNRLSSGIYFYTLTSGSVIESKKMVLMK